MPPKYPFVLLPLFLITSYYFSQINLYGISAIYILLYLFFLLSYIFTRRWIIPLIFNFIPGLIPGLLTNQLAVLAHENPVDDVLNFLAGLVFFGILGGFSLRCQLSGVDGAGTFGVILVIILIIMNLIDVGGFTSSPIVWVDAIYLISPFYIMTSMITQLKHSEYKGFRSSSSYSNSSVQTYTTLPVHFWIRGLPQGTPVTIVVNGVMYTTTSGYLKVQQNGVNEYQWSALEVTVNNETYVPHVRSGVLSPGQGIVINYNPATQTQAPQPSQRSVVGTAKSRKLSPKILSNWDPNVWVGRTLYVYKIVDVVGEGGNGYVLKGEYNGKEVAVKVLKLDYGNASQYFKDLFKESSNLVAISSNPKVVRIYGVYVNEQVIEDILKGNLELYETHPPMIAMEFMKGGTLSNLLLDDSFFYSSKWEKTVYRAIRDVAEALYFIHSQGYVHMDVKPQNIFLTERPSQPYELDNVQFKLGDLGSAVRVNSSIVQLTPMYSPPEVYQSVARPTIDIFALGMTMYVLLTRKEDRPDLNEMEEAFDCYVKGDMNCVKLKVETAKAKLAKWTPNVPDAVKPLLTRMLSPDPSVRPTAKEVAEYLDRLIP
jgi:hypothetical protein